MFQFTVELGNRFLTSFRHSRFIMKKSYFQPKDLGFAAKLVSILKGMKQKGFLLCALISLPFLLSLTHLQFKMKWKVRGQYRVLVLVTVLCTLFFFFRSFFCYYLSSWRNSPFIHYLLLKETAERDFLHLDGEYSGRMYCQGWATGSFSHNREIDGNMLHGRLCMLELSDTLY